MDHFELSRLESYRHMYEIERELASLKTPVDFDDTDIDQVLAQVDRLKRRREIDVNAARSAFRLEVASKEGEFLEIEDRLALLAAYDPIVIQRHERRNAEAISYLNGRVRSVKRAQRVEERELELRQSGIEGYDIQPPIINADVLSASLRLARDFTIEHAGKKVAILAKRDSVLVGTMPEPETSFAFRPPTITDDGSIQYHVLDAFRGIHTITHFMPSDPVKNTINSKFYLNLLSTESGEMIANPQLNDVRQALGLTGLNVYSDHHANSFTYSIGPLSVAYDMQQNALQREGEYVRRLMPVENEGFAVVRIKPRVRRR